MSNSFRRGSRAAGVAEITKRCTFHNGLGAGERHFRVESLNQGEVPVAREQCAQFGNAEGAIHFGIPTARHVEREALIVLFQHIHLQRAPVFPVFEGSVEVFQRISPHCSDQLCALGLGDLDDGLAQDFQDTLAVELPSQRFDERCEDAGFDLTAGEYSHFMKAVGRKGWFLGHGLFF